MVMCHDTRRGEAEPACRRGGGLVVVDGIADDRIGHRFPAGYAASGQGIRPDGGALVSEDSPRLLPRVAAFGERCPEPPASLLMQPKAPFLRSTGFPSIGRRVEVDLRLVPAGFLALILVGAVLLMLPWGHRPGQSVGALDAAFVAVSATCVTGLTPLNVAETFNTFGQAVILGLIQLGGLGIFTASISLVLLSGRKLSLADEQVIRTTVGRVRKVRPLDVFLYGCVFIVIFELAGTVALFSLMESGQPDPAVGGTL